MRILKTFLVVCLLMALPELPAYTQGSAASSLGGVVSDQSGAVIPGAEILVKNAATGAEAKTITAENGTFSVPALDPGAYTVTVSLPGFKLAVINNVKIDVGIPATLRVTLEIGDASETVEVRAGAEILQAQTATIGATISVVQVSNLPLVSRNPINALVLLPGVNTSGTNRTATINGLPSNAINVTIDGINVQDNFNKTTDGFFARVPPSIDSVQEVSVSTAANEAMVGSQGSVQIRFVTRQGTNEFHGSVYEYHRNPSLNSNYWFNNRDIPPDSRTGKAPRARVLLNQYGFRVGGPITIPGVYSGRNRAFFFINYEEFKQPSQVNRQRTILSPNAQQGIFQYSVGSSLQSVDLLALAGRNGQTSTADPIVAKLLADIRSASSSTGGISELTNPNLQRFTYSPKGIAINRKPTARLDFNLTNKHHVEASWNYQQSVGGPDFLNNSEPRFPGFPNQGTQPSTRWSFSFGVRSTLTPRLVNEARVGRTGGSTWSQQGASPADFTGPIANQGGFNLNIGAYGGITTATSSSAPARRRSPFNDISEVLSWTRGTHSISFGGQYSWVDYGIRQRTVVPTINFGVDTNDPANSIFTVANFVGASATDLTDARNLYAVLTGRVVSITGNARADESTGQYVYLGTGLDDPTQTFFGLFTQDSWRARPNLTLSYGLRWDVHGPYSSLTSNYSNLSIDELWGVSGAGNLFKPGVMTGRVSQFTQFKNGDKASDTRYGNFAPSFGFAWTPRAVSPWLKKLLGESGATVIRGGYAIAYNRRGMGDFINFISNNPGGTIAVTRDLSAGNLVGGALGTLPVLLREANRLGPPPFPSAPVYPLTGAITNSGNTFDPKIRVPYTESWSLGIQRGVTKDTAIEIRYVGNRFLQNWTTYNFNANENNIVENGLLEEFKLAQANLRANIAAGRGNTFAYTGAAGTSPLPITLAYFSGLPASQAGATANYNSSNFTNTTFLNTLALNNPIVCNPTGTGVCSTSSYAALLDAQAAFRDNAQRAGLPKNFMLTNPDLRGGANFIGNGGGTRYDGLQLELRRRMSRGLLLQTNYEFAKGFTWTRSSFRSQLVKSPSTNVQQHALKLNWVYEVPMGQGKALLGNVGRAADRIFGGWEFHGSGRAQTGQLYNFGNVNLVGMTINELKAEYKLRDDGKNLYLLPQDIINNTIKAFSTSATSATGYGASGAPSGRYLAPASSANCIQVFPGQCAPETVFVTGPAFIRFDLSLVKRILINERFNFELRGEFLNAFNNANFTNLTGAAFTSPTSPTFGQVTTAYSDLSNTQDPRRTIGSNRVADQLVAV